MDSVVPPSRRMWRLVEPIHAITYFAPVALEALARAGYRGFWMGYFAGRLAPLGAVGPQVGTAVCYGFAPSRVARALPDAWSFAPPDDALAARLSGATATLRRVGGETPGLEVAADLIWEAAVHAATPGRVLAAANQTLLRPDDPMGAVWQAATTLREHRGEGHNAALVAAGVTPVQAHWLKIAAGESEDQALAASRGWPDETWEHGRHELQVRGWLDPESRLTSEGRTARQVIEDETDAAAASPWDHLGPARTDTLAELLTPLTGAVRRSGILPFPNPIGLS